MPPVDLIDKLSQFGGMAVLAAVLLWLHSTSLRRFEKQMAEERGLFRRTTRAMLRRMDQHQRQKLTRMDHQHETVLREIVATRHDLRDAINAATLRRVVDAKLAAGAETNQP